MPNRLGKRILLALALLPGAMSATPTFADDPTLSARRLERGVLASLGSPEDKDRNRGVYGAIFSPNGALVATRSTDARVRIWNAATGKRLGEFEPYEKGRIKDLAFSNDGKTIATISSERTEPTIAWNIATGEAAHKWDCTGDMIRPIDGATGFRVVDRAGIRELSLDGAIAVKPLPNTVSIADFSFAKPTSPGTRNPFSGNAIIYVPVISRLTERSVHFAVQGFEGQRFTYDFGHALDGGVAIGRFSGSGRFAAAATRSDSRVLIADLASPDQRTARDLRVSGVDCLAFSPDERHLFVARKDGSAVILETLTQKEIANVPCIGERIFAANFSPDGRRFVTGHSGSRENRAVIWDYQKLYLSCFPTPATGDLHRAVKLLEDANPKDAYKGLAQLVEQPQEAIRILRKKLNLESGEFIDTSKFDQFVADLDADRFEVRENANEKLLAMRNKVKDRLEQALEDAVSLESRIRIRKILEIRKGVIPGEGSRITQRRALRSIHALEIMGNDEARELLTKLSQVEVDRQIAAAAKAAISRLP